MDEEILPAELYRDLLEVHKWGSALWCPGKQYDDIHIGDVGFVADGYFHHFFFAPKPFPIVERDLPQGFRRLPFDPDKDVIVEKAFLKAYEVYHSPKLKVSRERISETEYALRDSPRHNS